MWLPAMLIRRVPAARDKMYALLCDNKIEQGATLALEPPAGMSKQDSRSDTMICKQPYLENVKPPGLIVPDGIMYS